MNRRLTGDPLPKIVPVRFISGSSNTKIVNVAANKNQTSKFVRPRGRIHPGYIDDQSLVFTRYLLPDTYGCPRFRFSSRRASETSSKNTAQKNPLIDSYYPILNCDNSEDQESQKTYSELPNAQQLPDDHGRLIDASITNVQSSLKPSIDSRTFTIYSSKSNSTAVPEMDNPQPQAQADLDKSCETSSGLECFSELHKRIAKLEEKLQHTLEKSIEINDKRRQKSGSVQKLFKMVSGVLDKSGKSKAERTPDSDKSDTEEELRNIKKRLENLEIKLKREKYYKAGCAFANQLQSETTVNSLLLKETENDDSCKTSKFIFKESDFTEPLHSDSELYYPKEYPRKNKKISGGENPKAKVKRTILSKRHFGKINPKVTENNKTTEKETFDKEVVLINFNNFKGSCDGDLETTRKKTLKKKKRKNRRNLCKKNSKMNLLTEANEGANTRELLKSWRAQKTEKYWGQCTCPRCPYRDLSSSLPLSPESIATSLHPSYEDSKTGKLQKSLYFFKARQNIKMPVLFEEIIAKPKCMSGCNSKAPKLSMRFVLSREGKNPLVTLRKLVKKLSHTHSSMTKDQ